MFWACFNRSHATTSTATVNLSLFAAMQLGQFQSLTRDNFYCNLWDIFFALDHAMFQSLTRDNFYCNCHIGRTDAHALASFNRSHATTSTATDQIREIRHQLLALVSIAHTRQLLLQQEIVPGVWRSRRRFQSLTRDNFYCNLH